MSGFIIFQDGGKWFATNGELAASGESLEELDEDVVRKLDEEFDFDGTDSTVVKNMLISYLSEKSQITETTKRLLLNI